MATDFDFSTILLGVRITPHQRRILEDAVRREETTLSGLTRRALAEYLAHRTGAHFSLVSQQDGQEVKSGR